MFVNFISASNSNFSARKFIKNSLATPRNCTINSFNQINYLPDFNRDIVSFKAKELNVFDDYKTYDSRGVDYSIYAHNKEISKRLKNEYSSDSFKTLFDFASDNGTFNLVINDKTHYVRTSLATAEENPLMSKLVWVTDSCKYLPILKDKYPDVPVPLIENISKFYKKQESNFNKVINNPIENELNHDYAYTAKHGVGHVFNPNNLRTHMWFPHTRLESAGLYLRTVCELISDGFNGANYGYQSYKDVSQDTVDSIANVTAYLKNITYPYAKSTGPWEETTFDITPSSDVAVINDGIRKIINLMYEPTENTDLINLRKRLLQTKNGKVFADEGALRFLLKIGEYRIRTNSSEEVPAKGGRSLDGALSFIAHTELFDESPVLHAKELLKRVHTFEKGDEKSVGIVRNHGVIRYSGDRYLNMTVGHKVNKDNKLSKNTEAQWFMSSDISKSCGVALQRLLDEVEQSSKPTAQEKKLIKQLLKKETEYINRAYARITGINTYKANGNPCPPFQVPEAYQAVKNSKGKILFVPGTHTPLAWAQVSLYDASKLFLDNLKRLENNSDLLN